MVRRSYENLEKRRQVKKNQSIKLDLNPLLFHTQEPQPLHHIGGERWLSLGGGGGGGGTVGVSHVYHNRDLFSKGLSCKGGGTCPWCPPASAAYAPPLLLLLPIIISPSSYRQTLETNPANHWQPISKSPSPSPLSLCCARFVPMLHAPPYGHSSMEPLWHATPTSIFPLLSIFETARNNLA